MTDSFCRSIIDLIVILKAKVFQTAAIQPGLSAFTVSERITVLKVTLGSHFVSARTTCSVATTEAVLTLVMRITSLIIEYAICAL